MRENNDKAIKYLKVVSIIVAIVIGLFATANAVVDIASGPVRLKNLEVLTNALNERVRILEETNAKFSAHLEVLRAQNANIENKLNEIYKLLANK